MDMEKLEKRVVAELSALFHAGEIKGERAARLRVFKGKVVRHHHWVKARAKLIERTNDIHNGIHQAAAMLEAGKTLTCIDVERGGWDRKIQEVGITKLTKDDMVSTNYVIKGVVRKRQFNFGETKFVSEDRMIRILDRELLVADAIVGHSVYIDIDHMKSFGVTFAKAFPVFDTGMWADTLTLTGKIKDSTLKGMLNYYSIPHTVLHCGGNDARYNMELLIKMMEDLK
jgi:hypothetical protein